LRSFCTAIVGNLQTWQHKRCLSLGYVGFDLDSTAESFSRLTPNREYIPHRPAKPREYTGFSLPNHPLRLHGERKLWRYSLLEA